jgi:hypothetical protein
MTNTDEQSVDAPATEEVNSQDRFSELDPLISQLRDQIDPSAVDELFELNNSLSRINGSIIELEETLDDHKNLKITDIKRSVEKVRHKVKLSQISAEGVTAAVNLHSILPHMFAIGDSISRMLTAIEELANMIVFDEAHVQMELMKTSMDKIHEELTQGLNVPEEVPSSEKQHPRRFSFASLFGLTKGDYSKQLQELKEMGFTDSIRCEELLQRHRGNVEEVIQKLVVQ